MQLKNNYQQQISSFDSSSNPYLKLTSQSLHQIFSQRNNILNSKPNTNKHRAISSLYLNNFYLFRIIVIN
ncbi:hypothetical protein FGO68_gene15412 [Halteria grandinella]|uniref:Uncharacterized protein n=1 Tax=Halteria grandinella TaxID=5974 RepID=A0A8J8NEI1_HALGN|nr:hypothetical protein FGO68_gene15412 [Halteria grandinella]